jgi:hypothetical protein
MRKVFIFLLLIFFALVSRPAFSQPNFNATGTMNEFGLPGEIVTCLSGEILIANRYEVWPQPLYAGTLQHGVFRILPFDSFPAWNSVGLNGSEISAMNIQHWGAGPADFLTVYAAILKPSLPDTTYLLKRYTIRPDTSRDTLWSSADMGLNKKILRKVKSIISWYYTGHEPPQPIFLGGQDGLVPGTLSAWQMPKLDSVRVSGMDNIPWNTYHLVWIAGSVQGHSVVGVSKDSGDTWLVQKLPVLDDSMAFCIALNPQNADTVYAGSTVGAWISIDGGNTWNLLSLQGFPIHTLVIDPLAPQNMYAANHDSSGIFQSTDGGSNWIHIGPGQGKNMSGTSTLFVTYQYGSTTQPYIFIGTLGSGVWIYQPAGAVGLVSTRDNPAPEIKLYQNYPNPFNPATRITFSLGQAGKVKIKILNVIGQEIKTVLSTYMTAGYHEIEFDMQNLPSGIYFCRLQLDTFHDVKKIILLK